MHIINIEKFYFEILITENSCCLAYAILHQSLDARKIKNKNLKRSRDRRDSLNSNKK